MGGEGKTPLVPLPPSTPSPPSPPSPPLNSNAQFERVAKVAVVEARIGEVFGLMRLDQPLRYWHAALPLDQYRRGARPLATRGDASVRAGRAAARGLLTFRRVP